MVITQSRPRRQETGRRYKSFRKKRLFEQGRAPAMTKLGEKKLKSIRTQGGNSKSLYLEANMVNLFAPKDNKYHRVEIKGILENEANRNFVRRNVITKGTVVETDMGKAKITSRPGQHGTMNAVLI